MLCSNNIASSCFTVMLSCWCAFVSYIKDSYRATQQYPVVYAESLIGIIVACSEQATAAVPSATAVHAVRYVPCLFSRMLRNSLKRHGTYRTACTANIAL